MPKTQIITRQVEALGPGAKARCQLVVVEGPDMGRAARIDERGVTVGTDAALSLVLTDGSVSARHLEVSSLDNGAFRLRDLESTNGTFYEGSRVSELEVPAGATLKVGRSSLRIQPEPASLEVTPSQSRRLGDLVGESLAMREVFAVLELAAQSDITLLVQGETGTGKELVARALHELGARRSGPFVAVDVGALPEGLIESELFGHVRGAFTGASMQRQGAFVRAKGGTLFLDELTSVPPAVQARLLRVLEERKVRPVGADAEVPVDVRVVAASRGELAAEVAAGRFRPDLFYRLSVLQVQLPPLRSRREDLPLLVTELLRHRGIDAGPVSGPNFDALRTHAWPGNVRELRNVIDRAVALSPGARSFADLKINVRASASEDALTVRTDLPFKEAKDAVVEVFERRYLRDLWERHGGNLSAAARDAQVDRKHLRELMRRHHLLSATDDEDGR